MKISATLTLLSMAYVASAAEATLKSTQQVNVASVRTGAEQHVAGLPALSLAPGFSSGSETARTAVSLNTNIVGTRFNHGTTTHHSAGMRMNTGFMGGPSGWTGFMGGLTGSMGGQDAYPGYDTGAFPGSYNGAYVGYIRAGYPGLGTGAYPGFFYASRRAFLSPVYTALMGAAQHGFVGGAYSRYFRKLYPGLFGMAYRSRYGSRLLGYGAAERFPMDFAGIQVPGPGPFPAQLPGPLPGDLKPGVSETANIGSTAAVSQSHVFASGAGDAAVLSGGQQNLVQAQSPRRPPA
uniref:HL34 antigen n=1 Tax=Haemaphysalis longicornis TaxID=44386 RepID=Q9GV31_HAELO|nr:HL34 antigen [Haemaphysalis longicornis]